MSSEYGFFNQQMVGKPVNQFFIAGGIYFLSSSDREITVTELAAMAKPASSGRKVIPKAG